LLFLLLGRFMKPPRPGSRSVFVRERNSVGFPFVLSRETFPLVERQIQAREFSLRTLARHLKAVSFRLPAAFAPQLRNLNTPAQWRRAAILSTTGGRRRAIS